MWHFAYFDKGKRGWKQKGHFYPGTGSKSAANDLKRDGDNQEKEGIYAE